MDKRTTGKPTGRDLLQSAVQAFVADDGTQYGAAAKIGIPQSALSNILRGLMPTDSQRRKIAKAFPAVAVESWGKV